MEAGSFTSRFTINGSDGLSFKAGQWMDASDLNLATFDTPQTSFETIANSALAVEVELPRMTLGIAPVKNPVLLGAGISAVTKAPDISAGIYQSLKAETVQNIVIGIDELKKVSCRYIDNDAAYVVGGEIKAFSLSIGKEVQVWYKAGNPIKDGDGCDFLKHP